MLFAQILMIQKISANLNRFDNKDNENILDNSHS